MDNLISVVVPLYNYEKFIKENIESIISQTQVDWELIVVDDCSTDGSVKVVTPFLKDKRIQLVRLKKNVGYGAAKNEGIVRSKGEYVVTLDADDILCRKSLYGRMRFLQKSQALWVHAKAYEFSGRALPYDFVYKHRPAIKRLEKMLKTKKYGDLWKSIHAQTVMMRRSVYQQVGLYEESMRSMSDKEMWARAINNVGRPGYLNRFVACYRRHSKQMHTSDEKRRKVKSLKRQLEGFRKKRSRGNFKGVRKLEG